MKKVIILCLLFLGSAPNIILAKEEIYATFSACVDGDTAKFIVDDEEITARFLAVDTPETKHPTKGEEPFGKEASNFTCNSLKNANNIVLAYDSDSDKIDKYDRHLVWVFVDSSLLQKQLIDKGYAKVAYLYGDYEHTELLKEAEQLAKDNKLGIWGDAEEEKTNYWLIGVIVLVILLIYICIPKSRKKIQSKLEKTIKKEIKKLQ